MRKKPHSFFGVDYWAADKWGKYVQTGFGFFSPLF
jgi:hypothetical protein